MKPPRVTHVYMCARVSVSVCTYVRVCARVHVNKEKTPCQGFSLTPYSRITYIHAHSTEFLSCETICVFMCAGDVVAHGASDRAIKSRSSMSLKARGMWRISTR